MTSRMRTQMFRSLLITAVLASAVIVHVQTGRPGGSGRTVPAAPATSFPPISTDPDVPVSGELTIPVPHAADCGPSKKLELFTIARKGAETVSMNCTITLTAEDFAGGRRITKRLIFETSGVTMDCGGGTINGGPGTFNYTPGLPDRLIMVEIRSTATDPDPKTGLPRWVPTRYVNIRHCKIIGSVKVYGSIGEPVSNSGRADWVTRVRSNAPRDIVMDDVTITGVQGSENLLYLFSGVGRFQLLNSWIRNEGDVRVDGVNVYLDSESYNNTFRHNRIEARTDHREVMSIDASSSNTIVDNTFSALEHGGIYLYRNCGQGGTVRHSTPSANQIVNNVFYYDTYTGDNPAIYVGQRNGTCCHDDCKLDNGYPFGSSVSNYDHATFNVVMENQIVKRSVAEMIKVGTPFVVQLPNPTPVPLYDVNAPNFLDHNETVRADLGRGAGCYVGDGYPHLIRDGEFTNVFHNANGDPVCRGYRMTCHDGVLSRSNDAACRVVEPGQPRMPGQVSHLDFECQATGTNSGCVKTVTLPVGARVIGAKAACNLESGAVSSADLDQVPAYIVSVLRASDVVPEGKCTLGNTVAHSGQAGVVGTDGLGSVPVSCRERDSNGGDCHIKGRLYFR